MNYIIDLTDLERRIARIEVELRINKEEEEKIREYLKSKYGVTYELWLELGGNKDGTLKRKTLIYNYYQSMMNNKDVWNLTVTEWWELKKTHYPKITRLKRINLRRPFEMGNVEIVEMNRD